MSQESNETYNEVEAEVEVEDEVEFEDEAEVEFEDEEIDVSEEAFLFCKAEHRTQFAKEVVMNMSDEEIADAIATSEQQQAAFDQMKAETAKWWEASIIWTRGNKAKSQLAFMKAEREVKESLAALSSADETQKEALQQALERAQTDAAEETKNYQIAMWDEIQFAKELQVAKVSETKIRTLSTPMDMLNDNEYLVIIRNMAGEDKYIIAVNGILPVMKVYQYVAQQKKMRNDKAITLAINCDILDRRVEMHTIEQRLKEHGHVMQLLVNEV